MSFEYFIGGRYLRAKRKQAFISLITILATSGVTVGVMALIVVIAVMSGFESDLKNRILGGQSHVIVTSTGGSFTNYARVLESIEKCQGVAAAAPLITTQVILRTTSGLSGAVLKGVDPGTAGRVIKSLAGISFQARKDPEAGEPANRQDPGIVLGRELARTLDVAKGDAVYLISPRGILSPVGHIPAAKRFQVTGYFESGMYEFDGTFAYIHLREAQKLLRMPEAVSAIEVRVDDIYQARSVANAIVKKLGNGFQARDWIALNKNLFSALKLEKVAMFIILTLIILVAAFNIASMLIMMVMEKTKDIAILKTIGAQDNSIRKIFVFKGMVIGSIGTICGFGLGLALCRWLRNYNIMKLTGDIYYFTTTLPVRLEPVDVLLTVLSALLICFLATLYPARQAAKLNPVEAIRYGR
jgi:lipoprotein-releasing system permease protein